MLFKKYFLFLLIFIVTTISIFLYPLKTQAAATCSSWDEAINKSWQLHEPYNETRNDIGVFYDFEWDKEKKTIKIKRNKENYPIVRFSLFNNKDIIQGSIVKSYNKINLSEKSDTEIEKIHKQTKKVSLELFNGSAINIGSKPYRLNDIKMDTFGLSTIQSIEVTKGIVEISFHSSFSNKRPDLLEILKKEGVYEDNNYSTLCNKTIENNDFPIENFSFNEYKYDEDVRLGLNNKTKINIPIMSLSTDNGIARVFREESGISFYRQDFRFHKFPFDKQKIKILIHSNKRSTSDPKLEINNHGAVVTFITPGKGAFINLEKFKKDDNYLKEWKIVSTSINSHAKITEDYFDRYLGKTINDIENILEIEIEIERHFEQYIYKIIIPVFLILSLAWFVLWIPTKEFETRLTTSMVALLSLIAYNFVFADDVPKLNYLTALDEYILLSYIFCCIPTFMSIWFSRFISTNQKKATLVNRKIRVWGIALYITASLWIFFPK
jgi:hypothetical protein